MMKTKLQNRANSSILPANEDSWFAVESQDFEVEESSRVLKMLPW